MAASIASPVQPCLSRPVPRPGFRKPAVRQARRRRAAAHRTGETGLRPQADGARHQHRSLSAIERDWRITRTVLEVLAETDHPVTITTKSDRVVRDIDLLAPMAAKGLAAVCLSITSLDPRLAATLEPRAPHPERRLAAVRRIGGGGIPVYVSIAPVIPAITDHEVEALIARAAEAGAAARLLPGRPPAARGRTAVPRLAGRAFSRPSGQGDGDHPLIARWPRQ